MIELICPHCGHSFPVLVVESRGFCKCGMDYELQPANALVIWTPDEEYTPGATVVVQQLERAEVH